MINLNFISKKIYSTHWHLSRQQTISNFNPFVARVPFLKPPKILEKLWGNNGLKRVKISWERSHICNSTKWKKSQKDNAYSFKFLALRLVNFNAILGSYSCKNSHLSPNTIIESVTTSKTSLPLKIVNILQPLNVLSTLISCFKG